MPRENKPGQFTSEVHETKKKAFEEGKNSFEVPVSQKVKEAEEALKEIGRVEGVRIAKIAFDRALSMVKEHHKEDVERAHDQGFGKGLETGNKMIGEASEQRGYDRGIRKGHDRGFNDGFIHGKYQGSRVGSLFGVISGGLAVIIGSIFGIVIERLMF